ncbi:MAG: hypothetical protein ABR549_07400, partial [Mycobacteriales bacterium]
IQSYTGQTLSAVAADTVTLDGIASVGQSSYAGYGSASVGGAGAAGYSGYGFVQTLQLPQKPVTAVTAVSVDDVALAATDYYWNTEGLLWRPYGFIWGFRPRSVVVTYNHGYLTIPSTIREVCLSAAARAFVNPTSALAEHVGNYQADNYPRTMHPMFLNDEEKARLDTMFPIIAIA